MTSNQRTETRQTGTSNGYRQSAIDERKQIKDDKTIIHIDFNRTLVNGKMCYGASDAQKAINKS